MTKHPIDSIHVHPPASLENLTLFPLFLDTYSGPDYITLEEAIEDHGLDVSEVSEGGSVPDLLVANSSQFHVLLIDGEELQGARQNRIVNTTLLLKPKSRVNIPVSCTEQGRWSYSSRKFRSGKLIMTCKARARKTRSVSESLIRESQFSSDQGLVWEDVDELHQKTGSISHTKAMSDAYAHMHEHLHKVEATIPCLKNQCGVIAMINGHPAGMDLLSRPSAYSSLHGALVRSYALEALTSRSFEPMNDPGSNSLSHCEAKGPDPDLLAARAFLEECAALNGENYDSIGHGRDWRFTSSQLVGIGLEADGTWIHMAYFRDA